MAADRVGCMLLLLLVLLLAGGEVAGQKQPAVETDPAILARLEQFQDWRFGLFIHWGPCSQWGARIAWPLSPGQHWARPDDLQAWLERGKDFKRFSRDYFALNTTFDPRDFDPHRWAEAAAYAGMKYVIFVTKCHDGFAMFRTGRSRYCVTDPSCPFHRNPRADITKAVLDAFRAKGIRTGVYFSMPDWHHPDYEAPDRPPLRVFRPNYDPARHPDRWRRYLEFLHGQVEELVTGYGPLDILWLDGGGGGDCRMDDLARLARRHQPGILIVHRGMGGRYENYSTPEQQIPGRPLGRPWETCMTMGDYWAYNPRDHYKSSRELLHILAGIVCKGGNLLLDIGPDAQGRIPPTAMARLRELGDWMRHNGEALHGTRPLAPYREGRVCLTRKGDTVYLIWLATDGQTRPPRTVRVSTVRPGPESRITLLGRNLEVKWRPWQKGMELTVPWKYACPLRGLRPLSRHAWVFKVTKAIPSRSEPQQKGSGK